MYLGMKMKRLIALLMAATMILSSLAVTSFAEDAPAAPMEGEETITGRIIPYGLYEPDEKLLYESSRGLKITCDRVHVTDVITAEITFSSVNYTKVVADGVEYEPFVDKAAGTTTFMVPVKINEEMAIVGTTVAMGGDPKDINYSFTVKLNKDALKPAARGALQDGYYTTTVSTKTKSWGWRIYKEALQLGYLNPSEDYDLPVTVKIEGGKIADVAYTQDPNAVMVNTQSDFNYLLWAMDGHDVEEGYAYLSKAGGNYETYHVSDPAPAKCGTGLKDQLIAKGDIAGVDTVTAATITSRAIIDSVDKSLTKAERGQKDDPEPVLPQPDTSKDIIPADGVYLDMSVDAVGTDVDCAVAPTVLYVTDGKIMAEVGVEERTSTYPYFYPDTEVAALAAGKDAWFTAADYDYGYKYTGSMYKNVPVKSLDKPLLFVIKSKSSGNWFNRLFTFKSEGLLKIDQNNEAVKAAFDNFIAVRDNAESKKADILAAKDALLLSVVDTFKKADYTAASYAEVEKAAAALKEVLAKEGATDEEIAAASDALDEAVAALKAKQAQKLTVKAVKKNLKVKNLKKKAASYKAVKVSGNKGKVSYSAKATGKSKKALKFKNGKITVKKGTKKGTYKMTVTVKAAATDDYKAASKKVTVSVKVK